MRENTFLHMWCHRGIGMHICPGSLSVQSSQQYFLHPRPRYSTPNVIIVPSPPASSYPTVLTEIYPLNPPFLYLGPPLALTPSAFLSCPLASQSLFQRAPCSLVITTSIILVVVVVITYSTFVGSTCAAGPCATRFRVQSPLVLLDHAAVLVLDGALSSTNSELK